MLLFARSITCTITRGTGDHFVKPCWMRLIDGWVTICEKSLGNQAAIVVLNHTSYLYSYCVWQQSAQIRTIWFILDGFPEHQLIKLLQTEHIYNPCIEQNHHNYWQFPPITAHTNQTNQELGNPLQTLQCSPYVLAQRVRDNSWPVFSKTTLLNNTGYHLIRRTLALWLEWPLEKKTCRGKTGRKSG